MLLYNTLNAEAEGYKKQAVEILWRYARSWIIYWWENWAIRR
jgi:hypothetical protein